MKKKKKGWGQRKFVTVFIRAKKRFSENAGIKL